MSNIIYLTPYTYLIKFKPTGQVYYGVRFAKGCSPNDLWETYFTSSKVVESLIEEHGKDAFEYEIRKTFDTADAAREWEAKVLQRMKVVNNDKWLNKTTNKSFIQPKGYKHSPETRKKMSEASKGKPKSIEHKSKMGLKGERNPMYGQKRSHTEKTRQKLSDSLKNKPKSESHKIKISKSQNKIFSCDICGYTNTPSVLGRHQKQTKHFGKTEITSTCEISPLDAHPPWEQSWCNSSDVR